MVPGQEPGQPRRRMERRPGPQHGGGRGKPIADRRRIVVDDIVNASAFLDLEGKEGLVAHLFAFNVGIELAQLLVVAVVLLISFVLVERLKISRKGWIQVASLLIFIAAAKMTFDRIPHNKNYRNEKTASVNFYPLSAGQRHVRPEHPKQSWIKPWEQV